MRAEPHPAAVEPLIDPTAMVAPQAVLGRGVEIGPFCRVGPGAVLHDAVRRFTLLGGPPQHILCKGEPTRLVIGTDCVIREPVSVHRGTAHGGGCAAVPMDVIPFGSVLGNHARLGGRNLTGLKRAGLERAAIHRPRAAFHELFIAEGPPLRARSDAVARRYADMPEVQKITTFIRANARRPIVGARVRRRASDL
jgi:UDP-N-acetylglucosamine acyltransferase